VTNAPIVDASTGPVIRISAPVENSIFLNRFGRELYASSSGEIDGICLQL